MHDLANVTPMETLWNLSSSTAPFVHAMDNALLLRVVLLSVAAQDMTGREVGVRSARTVSRGAPAWQQQWASGGASSPGLGAQSLATGWSAWRGS